MAGLDFSSNEDFLSSLGESRGVKTSSIDDLLSGFSSDKEGALSFGGGSDTSDILGGVGSAVGQLGQLGTTIAQGVLKNKSIDQARESAQKQSERQHELFLQDQAENERVNKEAFDIRKESAALQARDAELGLRFRKFQNEFNKSIDDTKRLFSAAGKLSNQMSARPDIADRISRK